MAERSEKTTDPYADLTLAGEDGTALTIVWIKALRPGARIALDGDQPGDRPPPSGLFSREQLRRLWEHLSEEFACEQP